MSATNQPLDPQEKQSSNTSEQLEVNQSGSEAERPEDENGGYEDLAALLSDAQAQVAQFHDELLRAKAEVENIRRRAHDDVAKARKFGTESFAESLVPVKDSLEAALALTDQTAQAWREGVEVTLKQLTNAFERNLLKEVAPAPGDKFDPHMHQAISTVPSEFPEGTVAQTLQKGYTIADRVLRPALVMVSSGQTA